MTPEIIWGCIAASIIIAVAAAVIVKTYGMTKSDKEYSFDNDSVHPVCKR